LIRGHRRKFVGLATVLVITLAVSAWVVIGKRAPSSRELLGPPPEVPRYAALDRILPAVEFHGTPLAEAVQWIADECDAKVVFDAGETSWPHIDIKQPTYARLRNITGRDAILWIVQAADPGYIVDESSARALICRMPPGPMTKRTYELEPWAKVIQRQHGGGPPSLMDKARDWIDRKLHPEDYPWPPHWDDVLPLEVTMAEIAWFIANQQPDLTYREWGNIHDLNHVTFDEQTVTVEATAARHRQVYDLLAMIWRIQNTDRGTTFAPTPAEQQTQEALQRPISVSLARHNLGDGVLALLEAAGLEGGVAAGTLEAAGVDMVKPFTFNDEAAPQTIGQILEPMIDNELIAITVAAGRDGRVLVRLTGNAVRSIECYNVADLFDPKSGFGFEEQRLAIAEHVRNRIYPDIWLNNGGLFGRIDFVGTVLIVEANRQTQREVWQLIRQMRKDGFEP
jgi:hypothetical protein